MSTFRKLYGDAHRNLGAATVSLAAKVDLKVGSELLRHSSVAITADIYAHVMSEMQQENERYLSKVTEDRT